MNGKRDGRLRRGTGDEREGDEWQTRWKNAGNEE